MTRGQLGASLFTQPFQPGEFRETTGDRAINLDHLLGERYESRDGKVFRLVKTHAAAFIWGKKVAVWLDDQAFTVTPCTAASQRVAGIADNALLVQSVPAAAYMWLQVQGRSIVIAGDDAGNRPTDGQYVITDDDADTGKVRDGGAVFTQSVTFARAQATVAATDAEVAVVIENELSEAA